jgi:hypothetical protein
MGVQKERKNVFQEIHHLSKRFAPFLSALKRRNVRRIKELESAFDHSWRLPG